MMKWSQGR